MHEFAGEDRVLFDHGEFAVATFATLEPRQQAIRTLGFSISLNDRPPEVGVRQ